MEKLRSSSALVGYNFELIAPRIRVVQRPGHPVFDSPGVHSSIIAAVLYFALR
jgi:hypothetical protein